MRITVRRTTAALLLAISCAAGCGGSSGESNPSVKACEDLADTLGKDAERCGLDYQANYDATVQTVAAGDCGNIVSVRDITVFYSDCIPFLAKLTCAQVNDPTLTLPESCNAQLLREQ